MARVEVFVIREISSLFPLSLALVVGAHICLFTFRIAANLNQVPGTSMAAGGPLWRQHLYGAHSRDLRERLGRTAKIGHRERR